MKEARTVHHSGSGALPVARGTMSGSTSSAPARRPASPDSSSRTANAAGSPLVWISPAKPLSFNTARSLNITRLLLVCRTTLKDGHYIAVTSHCKRVTDAVGAAFVWSSHPASQQRLERLHRQCEYVAYAAL